MSSKAKQISTIIERQVQDLARRISSAISANLAMGMSAASAVHSAWITVQVPDELKFLVQQASAAQLLASMGLLPTITIKHVQEAAKHAILLKASWGDGGLDVAVSRNSAKLRESLTNIVVDNQIKGEGIYMSLRNLQEASPSSPAMIRKDLMNIVEGGPQLASQKAKSMIRKLDLLQSKPEIYTGYLKQGYKDLLAKVMDGTPKQVAKAIEIATMEKARSDALRITRTEQERAYYLGEAENIARDPYVKAVKIRTASTHSHPDICDAVSHADCGYGPGIYPLDQAPTLPLHPNCGCMIYPVYVTKGSLKTAPSDAISAHADTKGIKLYQPAPIGKIESKIPQQPTPGGSN